MSGQGETHSGNAWETDFERKVIAFARWCENGVVASKFHRSLGPEGTLRVVNGCAFLAADNMRDSERQTRLMGLIRISLRTATGVRDFPAAEFGRGLALQATAGVVEPDRGDAYFPSAALAFLLLQGRYELTVLIVLGERLESYERTQDDSGSTWSADPAEPLGHFLTRVAPAITRLPVDPMTAYMIALRNNPAAALDFFTAGDAEEAADRVNHYVNYRRWDGEGRGALTGALDGAVDYAPDSPSGGVLRTIHHSR